MDTTFKQSVARRIKDVGSCYFYGYSNAQSLGSAKLVGKKPRRMHFPLLAFMFALFSTVGVANASERFIVPLPADHALDFLTGIASDASCNGAFASPNPAEPMNSVTDFVVRVDGSIIVIDHWEDGYEPVDLGVIADDPSQATQSTTRIYGDGLASNGAVPGVNTNAADVLVLGQVVVFNESFTIADLGTEIEVRGRGGRTEDGIDGADKIFATDTINVTRAQWAGSYDPNNQAGSQSGTLFAGAFELFPQSQWGQSFTLPVGETSGAVEFEWTGVTIMAANDGTEVSVDANGDLDFLDPSDVAPGTVTLDAGETLEVSGRNDTGNVGTGMNEGAKIITSDIVQVNIVSGQECSNYQSRWFTLFPDALLGSTYYEPVSTPGGNATKIYLYNPSTTAISVDWEVSAAAAGANPTPAIAIPPRSSVGQIIPNGTGAKFFTNNGDTFGALTVTDQANTAHDWGHASTSDRLMGNIIQVGYAEGDDPSSDEPYTGFGENGAPVWLIADNPSDPTDLSIDICVDVAGDGGVNTDSFTGRDYDYLIALDRLDSARLYDGGRDTPNATPAHIDGDQTGMLAFVCDGSDAILAAAWGQDPLTASPGRPAVDVGTTVRSVSANVAFIGDTIFEDLDSDGIRDPGERGLPNVSVLLYPPANVNLGNGPGQPLLTRTDFNGSYLFTRLVNGDYRIEVIAPSGFTQTYDPDLTNGDPLTLDNQSFPTIADANGRLDQDFGYNNGVPVGNVGDTIYYDVNGNGIQEPGEAGIPGIQVQLCSDTVIPTLRASDNFDIGSYNNNAAQWSGPWTENNDSGNNNPNNGVIRITGNELRVAGNNNNPSLTRTVSLANLSSPRLRFDWRGQNDVYEANDIIRIQISINNAAFTNIRTFLGQDIDNVAGSDDIPLPAAAAGVTNVRIRFLVESGFGVDQERMFFDDLEVVGDVITNICETLTTDANGLYLFTGKVPADYTIEVLNPPVGYTNTDDPGGDANNTNQFTLFGNGGNLEQDFGYYIPATVIGHVYLDTNGNGVQDVGEPNIPNLDVLITDSIGNLHIVTTDANGDYVALVPPGTTQVDIDETDPQYPTGFTQTDGVDPSLVTAVAGATVDAGDDGYYQGNVIGDTVFFDADGNGVQDGGETGIPNRRVTLTPPAGVDIGAGPGNSIHQFTNASGNYSFVGLPDGTYTVTVTPPSGYNNTADPDGGADSTSSVTVSGGVTNNLQDFGYQQVVPSGRIGDRVFGDSNGNGIQDVGELGLSGIQVQICGDLDDNNGTANTCRIEVTNGNGDYLFGDGLASVGGPVSGADTGLPATGAGEVYTVRILNPPAGQTNTADPDNGLPNFSQLTLATGASNLDQDFGYSTFGTVSGHLYIDTNGNGTQDPGEPDLANVDVIITDSNGATQVVQTNNLGDYSASVPAGSTTVDVDETDPQFPLNHLQTEGTDPTVVTAVASVNVSAGIDGYAPAGQIGDFIFFDSNLGGTQGVFDPGIDDGIQGVTVTLTPPGGVDLGNGPGVAATRITDANGNYSFGSLPAGSYTVAVTQPSGTNQTVDPNEVGVCSTCDNTSVVVLAAGQSDLDQDFGYGPTVPLGRIGDRIFNDTNGNGIQDGGETGIAGIIVELCGDLDDNDGTAPTCTTDTTDGNGDYLFTGIPGTTGTEDYTVTVTNPPANSVNTADPDGGNPNVAQLTLPSGFSNLDQDFGYASSLVDVTGNVSRDDNGDGIGDANLSGVTVQLYTDPNGDGNPADGVLYGQATTDGSGNYLFSDVPIGDYVLVEIDLAGLVSVNDGDATPDVGGDAANISVIDSYLPVSLAGGEGVDADNNFVDAQTASLGGKVWLDEDFDGILDTEETGITGVTVQLLRLGVVVGTIVTDANGNYLFPNITPDDYTVNVVDGTLPTGLTNTAGVGGVDPKAVTVEAGDRIRDVNFGYIPAGVNRGAIGDRVWSDADGDGIQDSGEAGIAGVLLDLVNAAGVVADTTTTNANGDYLFTDVALGEDYTVRIAPADAALSGYSPTVGPQSEGGYTSNPVTLDLGLRVVMDLDFGFDSPATNTVRDTIWFDQNGDGVLNDDLVPGPNEPLISGVTVDILNGSGDVVGTTVSNLQGVVEFTGLPDGTYTLRITDQTSKLTGLTGTTDEGVARVSDPVVVAGGQTVTDTSFGYNNPGLIAGVVYSDANSSADQESNEAGFGGVLVTLLEDTDNNGSYETTVTTTRTNPDGSYAFDGLPPGIYRVQVTPPNGIDTEDPDVVLDDQTDITLRVGESSIGNDFGYFDVALNPVSGTVFLDADKDGIEDVGELGIANVSLDLRSFEYTVIDGRVDLNQDGSVSGGLDTGFYLGYRIRNNGRVDIDGDGDVDNDDDGFINGIQIIDGFWDFDGNGDISPGVNRDADDGVLAAVSLAQTVTDANGDYMFAGLADGAYTVSVTDNAALLTGYDITSGLDTLNAVVAGAPVTDVDFGYIREEATGSLSGEVWIDEDSDGFATNPEFDLSEVDVHLCRAPIVAAGATFPDGVLRFRRYDLAALNPTVSTVDEIELGVVTLDATSSTFDMLPSDNQAVEDFGYVYTGYINAPTTGTYTFQTNSDDGSTILIDGELVVDNDGLHGPITVTETVNLNAGYHAIEVRFFERGGGNVLAADFSLPGPVNLVDLSNATLSTISNLCDPAHPNYVATTTTDAKGEYIFKDLPPGEYVVDADPADIPYGLAETVDPTPPSSPVKLSEGEDVTNVDIGHEPTSINGVASGVMSGFVWVDSDNDGRYDNGEAPIAGVTIRVRDTNQATNVDGNRQGPVVYTTTTKADGSWIISDFSPTGLLDGFLVEYVQGDIDTAAGVDLIDNQPTNFPLGDFNYFPVDLFSDPDNNISFLDFGFVPVTAGSLGSIAGTVYSDADQNGDYLAATDGELQSVSLNLLNSSGTIVASTITAADGSYLFSGLRDDSYTVVISDINNVTKDQNPFETIPTPIVIAGGNDVTDQDAGFISDTDLFSIGSRFFFDSNNNGFSDDNEPGVQGVIVQCWLDADNSQTPGDPSIPSASVVPQPGVDNLIRTVRTDKDGEYYCTSLPAGRYIVRVLDAGAYTEANGANVTGDAGDNWAKNWSYALQLSDAAPNYTADFGVVGNNSLSGTIVIEDPDLVEPNDDGDLTDDELDATPGGVSDDSPAANVTVELYVLQGGSYVKLTETITDVNGDYTFGNLPDGSYRVEVVTNSSPIDGFGQTGDPDLANDPDPEARVCDSNTAPLCDDRSPSYALSAGTDLTDIDFAYQRNFATTPVTMNFFSATRLGDVVEFNWETSNEVGHAGFQIYARNEDDWELLNETLIIGLPGHVLSTRSYTFQAATNATWFALVDVSNQEEVVPHGPFRVDESYGANMVTPEAFDWRGLQPPVESNRDEVREVIDRRIQEMLRSGALDDSLQESYDEAAVETE